MPTIYLQPIGDVDERLISRIAAAVGSTFDLLVGSLPPMPIPDYAFDSARGQYHSTAILRVLASLSPGDALRVLGITDVDIFVPRMNFVFGEAAVGGKVSVISLYRLRPEFYGQPPDEELLTERAIKEAVHELGHTFGLHHCSDPACVMYFSNNIRDTDRKSAQFCGECARRLRSALEQVRRLAAA